jgi:hypothetical protein
MQKTSMFLLRDQHVTAFNFGIRVSSEIHTPQQDTGGGKPVVTISCVKNDVRS